MPEIDVLDKLTIDSRILGVVQSAPLPGLDEFPQCRQTAADIQLLTESPSALRPELLAGLWLLAGDLEKSHLLSQNLPSREGALWHAIMHRREGDFWNSKYWYRKAGNHPICSSLAELLSRTHEQREVSEQSSYPAPLREFISKKNQQKHRSEPGTMADAIVDGVQLAVNQHQDWQLCLQRVCWWEWQLLFQYCWDNQ